MAKKNNSITDLNAKTIPQVSYSDGGRSGTIHYRSPETSFDVWYELALSPAVAIIGIPEPNYWEAQTKTPLSERDNILQFIGQQVVNDKLAGAGYCQIESDAIMTIYSGKNPDLLERNNINTDRTR